MWSGIARCGKLTIANSRASEAKGRRESEWKSGSGIIGNYRMLWAAVSDDRVFPTKIAEVLQSASGAHSHEFFEIVYVVEGFMPVSYTHLDVYKRQILARSYREYKGGRLPGRYASFPSG